MHGSASSSGGFKGSEAMALRDSSHRVNMKQASKRMLEWMREDSKLVLSTHCVCTHHGIRCWVGINPFDAGGSSQDGAVTGLVGEGERVCSEAAQGHSTMALSLHGDCRSGGQFRTSSLTVSCCCLQRVSQPRQIAYLHELEERGPDLLGLDLRGSSEVPRSQCAA